jgi:hypothetical protein
VRSRKSHFQLLRTFIVWTLLANLLLIIAAVVTPALHQWMHADSHEEDHDCAITLFASGACVHAPTVTVVPAPKLVPLPDKTFWAAPRVVSSFHFIGILEHAPPPRA